MIPATKKCNEVECVQYGISDIVRESEIEAAVHACDACRVQCRLICTKASEYCISRSMKPVLTFHSYRWEFECVCDMCAF